MLESTRPYPLHFPPCHALATPASCAMIALADIKRYCNAIAAAFKPQKIILFGSYAYGRPNEDSDVDVLVIMPKSRRLGHRPALKIREKVEAGFPVDVIVRDPAFIRERLREGDCFLKEITGKGKVMYESRHA
ncbi:MAG: nucleotidyltransferase domain-containing protein [Prosthecobacter sp.]|nr:nucleotidyltransferase domain-containing protein [Prosthecobacter sp.]